MNESDPPLLKKQSVSVSQTSPKPEDLLFKNFSDVYNKNENVFGVNPMSDNIPLNYLKNENKNPKPSPYYIPGKLGGKTRRRSKYNKKSRRGGRGVFGSSLCRTFTKRGKGGKSRKSRRGSKSRK
jgi:hypothetical protein